MKRYTDAAGIEQAARVAQADQRYVGIHQKSTSRITEALKVRNVGEGVITFDRSAYGLPDVDVRVDDLHYLEA